MQLPRVSGDDIGCVGVGCDDVVKEYECKSFMKPNYDNQNTRLFISPAFVPKHRVCRPLQEIQHNLESTLATALLRCEPVIPLIFLSTISFLLYLTTHSVYSELIT